MNKKREQESRRCKHSEHPTTHIRKDGVCPRARKCKDKYNEGCLVGKKLEDWEKK